ncbi:MAG: alcohol dehydrogenase catalytic domain-containing protein [Eubacterium sp.]|nr:alcohol dehydrogenase catalytic domain-containing protein [Eubacterium sp.]
MKAGVFYGKEDLRIEDVPVPEVGPGQMLVKISYVGICGTDVEFYKTGMTPPFAKNPLVLGHENCGVVEKVGEGVTKFKVGDRVLCGPPSHCAEDCPACKVGRTNICINGFPRTAGLGQYDGGYAPYLLIHDVEHTMIVPVPDEVDFKDAVLFDVICVSLHGVRMSNFKFGDDVVVSGTGPIGLSAIQILKAAGANKVIALGTTSAKEPIIKEYGADYFINSKECEDLAGEIKKILGKEVGADVVFECAGNMKSLSNCVYECVKPGGQICVVGTIQEPMSALIPGRFSVTEPNFQFSFTYTEEDVKIYLDMVDSGKLVFPNMVTGVVSLDECVEKVFASDRKGQIKVLIDPSL